jgi:hypothetical protein
MVAELLQDQSVPSTIKCLVTYIAISWKSTTALVFGVSGRGAIIGVPLGHLMILQPLFTPEWYFTFVAFKHGIVRRRVLVLL